MTVGSIVLFPRESIEDASAKKDELKRRDLEVAALSKLEKFGLRIEAIKDASILDLEELMDIEDDEMEKLRKLAIRGGSITLGIVKQTT